MLIEPAPPAGHLWSAPSSAVWPVAGVDTIDDVDGRVEGTAVEKVMWLVLGSTVMVASLFAGRSDRARLVARVALGVLFLVFGAMVNVIYLVTDWNSFAEFGEMSQLAFVRDTWASLVGPNTGVFIGLLIVGEAAAGILVLCGGRWTQAGLVLLLAFHVGLLFFGWWLWLYAVPMLGALTLLLRAERRPQQEVVRPRHGVRGPATGADAGLVAHGEAAAELTSRPPR